MKTEYKSFRAEIKAAGDKGEFEAVIATLNTVDHDGDIITPGAFGDGTASIMPAHDHQSVPLGKAKIEERGNMAIAVGKFNLDIQDAKDWHSALQFDLANGSAVQEWSFGFRVIDSEEETRDEQPVRILKKMDVMEYSPVLRGAGVGTGTLSAKGTFEQQLETTLKAVEDTLSRAKQIAELRAAKDKPKTLSDERKAQLAKIVEKFRELETVLKACESKANGDEDDDEVSAMADCLLGDAQRLGVALDR